MLANAHIHTHAYLAVTTRWSCFQSQNYCSHYNLHTKAIEIYTCLYFGASMTSYAAATVEQCHLTKGIDTLSKLKWRGLRYTIGEWIAPNDLQLRKYQCGLALKFINRLPKWNGLPKYLTVLGLTTSQVSDVFSMGKSAHCPFSHVLNCCDQSLQS